VEAVMGVAVYGSEMLSTREIAKRESHLRWLIREAEREAKTPCVGSRQSLCGGACCLDCRRYVDAGHFKRVKIGTPVLDNACEWCGRVNEERREVEGIDG
jgi:hypothetical protein